MQNSEEKKLHEEYYTKSENSNSLRYKWYKERYFNNMKGKKILEISRNICPIIVFPFYQQPPTEFAHRFGISLGYQ